MYSSASSELNISVILSIISSRLQPIFSLLQSSPLHVAIFLFSTFALESTSLPVAALDAARYPVPTVTLRKGNTGYGVKWVQWHLKQTVSPAITVGGIFSTYTHTSVCNFQRKYGLDVDGIVGPATRKKMQEVCNE